MNTATLELGFGLLLLALAGCGTQTAGIEREGALLTRLSSGPVVNGLADPGDGFCDASECTLREAIASAEPGATITFAVTGTIVLQTPLDVDRDLTIEGPGAASLAVSGNDQVRVFDIAAGTAVRIAGLTITHGKAVIGGGILSYSEDLVLSHLVVANNLATLLQSTAPPRGGGIANYGTLTLEDSHVTANRSVGSDSVMAESAAIFSMGPLTVTNSAITQNSVNARTVPCPGICARGPTTITNSTVAGNWTHGGLSMGGGIRILGDHPLVLVNSTVAGNNAARGGGVATSSAVTLVNSIVAANSSYELGYGADLHASMVTALHSVIGDPVGHMIANGIDGNIVGISGADLRLGPLADNGGITPTRVLLEGSPAIDAGTSAGCPATDQRGVSRPQGPGCDIGAFEYGYPVFTGFASPVNDEPTLNIAKAGQTIPLKWHLADVFGNPITDLETATVSVASLACTAGTTTDAVEEYAAGTSGLQNLGDGYYHYNWATPKGYARSCKTMRLDLGDGIAHTALFQFTK